jgi:hypothetical protein
MSEEECVTLRAEVESLKKQLRSRSLEADALMALYWASYEGCFAYMPVQLLMEKIPELSELVSNLKGITTAKKLFEKSLNNLEEAKRGVFHV